MNEKLGVWTYQDCALVLIDYQKEMFDSIRSETKTPLADLNVRLLAKTAKAFGMPDVFAHGMLSMAYLAQLLTRWVPQSQIRTWGVRFVAITPVHAKVICTGKVVEKFEADGERRVRLEINAHTDAGLHTLAGDAVIALP